MAAGKFRHRITIQQKASGHDAIGQPLTGWTDVATVWASIIHNTGLQAIKANAEASVLQTSIRLRWMVGLGAAMRVLHGTDVYEIKAVLPDAERRRHVDLVCEIGGSRG